MSNKPWPEWNQDIENGRDMTDRELMQKTAETINEFVHHNKANWTETLRLLNERLSQQPIASGQQPLSDAWIAAFAKRGNELDTDGWTDNDMAAWVTRQVEAAHGIKEKS
jgi:glutathione S-transferase